jgi:hypothetical protein
MSSTAVAKAENKIKSTRQNCMMKQRRDDNNNSPTNFIVPYKTKS